MQEIKEMNPQRPDYKSEIVEILRSNSSPIVKKEKIHGYHENDIADALELLSHDERLKLYRLLDVETLSNVLEYTEEEFDTYFEELGIKSKLAVLKETEVGTVVDYLRHINREERDNLIELMDEETKDEVGFIATFDEDEIGSKISTNYISVCYKLDIKGAMSELIAQAADNDNISTIYVVDEEERYVGAIELKDLIRARETDSLHSLMASSYPYIYANELIDECIERIKDYQEDSFPVLDLDNKLKGVFTSQDLAVLIDEEMGEDYAKLAGLSAEEDLNEPLKTSISKRLPWLVILLVLGLVVSSVVGVFESVVSSITVAICFQSLILDMSGNVGTQSLAVTIRVLMDEELDLKQKLNLIFKESKVGLFNGMILGTLSFVFIGLYLWLIKGEALHFAFAMSTCTGIALMVAMFLSSISGTVVPLIFKKLKIDPAVASGPLITTINDLVAVVTYYGLVWVLLINILSF